MESVNSDCEQFSNRSIGASVREIWQVLFFSCDEKTA